MTLENPIADSELTLLLNFAGGWLYKATDPDRFLEWIAETGPIVAPALAAEINPDTGPVQQFFRILGVHIYNNTPLPKADYTLKPIPKPNRNQPCLCGSGRKFKHCCIGMDSQPLLEDYNMLRHLLDHCTLKELANLPDSRVDTKRVADTAAQWMTEGDFQRAKALLEPWFKPSVPLKRRHCPLFDLLMDVYLQLDHPVKRKRLIDRACQADDQQLRAEALECRVTMEIDKGQTAAAWKSFNAAQRINPNSPSLTLLEIMLLCSSDEVEQAKARATFALAKFRRDRHTPPEFLDLLAQCTEDPVGALQATMSASLTDPVVGDLIDLLKSLPSPKACHKIELYDSEAMLQSNTTLSRLEEQWTELAQTVKPSLTRTQHDDTGLWDTAPQWLPFLERNPTLCHSFEVLDDLVMAVDALQIDVVVPTLLEPLLDQATALLEANLAKVPANEGFTLPWLMLENRPALRLLAHRAFHQLHYHEDNGPAFINLAERLLTLNPSDNHGVRSDLSTAYLANGLHEKAIALADQFPDDILCTLPLNKVLALYLSEQQGQALTHLAKIANRYGVALKMLLTENPRPPKFSDHGIKVGGKDEAWLYREATLYLWQQQGAFQWLKQAHKSLPRS